MLKDNIIELYLMPESKKSVSVCEFKKKMFSTKMSGTIRESRVFSAGWLYGVAG